MFRNVYASLIENCLFENHDMELISISGPPGKKRPCWAVKYLLRHTNWVSEEIQEREKQKSQKLTEQTHLNTHSTKSKGNKDPELSAKGPSRLIKLLTQNHPLAKLRKSFSIQQKEDTQSKASIEIAPEVTFHNLIRDTGSALSENRPGPSNFNKENFNPLEERVEKNRRGSSSTLSHVEIVDEFHFPFSSTIHKTESASGFKDHFLPNQKLGSNLSIQEEQSVDLQTPIENQNLSIETPKDKESLNYDSDLEEMAAREYDIDSLAQEYFENLVKSVSKQCPSYNYCNWDPINQSSFSLKSTRNKPKFFSLDIDKRIFPEDSDAEIFAKSMKGCILRRCKLINAEGGGIALSQKSECTIIECEFQDLQYGLRVAQNSKVV